ncbi:glucose-6-phosphate dehydrogenase assembly protein OpcA [Patulibacter defluvii]|uniref:glucose-6-phosphate dehydrogenase assembly protein OpcA n=1 Tax=Patulibacter defluvii TaxID=3095358 RepID=UPI002A755A2C|nr:glucose-6-phosphate dehydrogenase assembly protein OpcA [Patulibacter sp. DM4]
MSTVAHTVWQQDDVDPAGVEQAMRALERERFRQRAGSLPARALNLVTVVDADHAEQVVGRLAATGGNAPSRSILLRVHPDRSRLSARVTLATGAADRPAAMNELVTVDIGPRHLSRLESIVDPMVLTDVPTLLWAPHGHRTAIDTLVPLAQTVLLDSSEAERATDGLDEALALQTSDAAAVVDLSWMRTLPWRQRLAAAFAPAWRRDGLARIGEVEVRHQPGSAAAGWLVLGWLASRLGWSADGDEVRDGAGQPVALRLVAADVGVAGLAGTTVAGRDGARFSLDRNPGGLRARDVAPDAAAGSPVAGALVDREWTILGASRGEAGVLSAALRRTLVPDDGYREALATARRIIQCT